MKGHLLANTGAGVWGRLAWALRLRRLPRGASLAATIASDAMVRHGASMVWVVAVEDEGGGAVACAVDCCDDDARWAGEVRDEIEELVQRKVEQRKWR